MIMYKVLFSLFILTLFSAMLYAETDEVKAQNVANAKELFSQLCAGNLSLADQIEWSHISMFSTDYSAEYAKLTTEQDKKNYRNDFIRKFGARCKENNVIPDSLSGLWLDPYSDETDGIFMLISTIGDYESLNLEFINTGSKLRLMDVYLETADDSEDY